MAITQAMCTSFKQELLTGTHNFTNGQDTFKLALFTSSANLDATTTAFSTSNEASGTGYSSGGNSLTNQTPTTGGTTAFADFSEEKVSEVLDQHLEYKNVRGIRQILSFNKDEPKYSHAPEDFMKNSKWLENFKNMKNRK